MLLAGCADEAENIKVEPTTAAETIEKNEEVEVVESPNTEETGAEEGVDPYSETEVEEFRLKLLEVEALAIEYLYNTKSDIYVCGKICGDQPLTDVQLSIEVSRNGLEKAAQQMASVVPEIENYANSGTPGVDKEKVQRVANQFKTSAEDMELLLTKENWSSWDEPGELIEQIIAELEEVSWLYKPYSSSISEEDAKSVEEDTNISTAIVNILDARDELQYQYSNIASIASIQPERENVDGVSFAQPYFFENYDHELETIIQAAQQALNRQLEENLRQEFEDSIFSAEALKTSIYEYNVIAESYGVDYSYDSTMRKWQQLNQTLDKIAINLEFQTYEMKMYQDSSKP